MRRRQQKKFKISYVLLFISYLEVRTSLQTARTFAVRNPLRCALHKRRRDTILPVQVVLWTSCLLATFFAASGVADGQQYLFRETVRCSPSMDEL